MIRALLHVWVQGDDDEDVDRQIAVLGMEATVIEKHRYETED